MILAFIVGTAMILKKEWLLSVFMVFNLYMRKGGDDLEPKIRPLHGRILQFTMDIEAFLLLASFTAVLTSFITAQPEPTKITTFQVLKILKC